MSCIVLSISKMRTVQREKPRMMPSYAEYDPRPYYATREYKQPSYRDDYEPPVYTNGALALRPLRLEAPKPVLEDMRIAPYVVPYGPPIPTRSLYYN
jgi:hypothetical protein